jgi:micrococcal nuclease
MTARARRRHLPVLMLPHVRRRRYRLRSAGLLSVVVAALLSVALADRAGLFGRAPTPDYQKYSGQAAMVVRTVDGDTLDVDIPDDPHQHTRIRLWGVDTPETVRPNAPIDHFGPEASRRTGELSLHRTVRLELVPADTRDKHGRLLAYVFLPDGRLLNALLVEEGFGYADPRFDHPRKREFARLHDQARRQGRGLWKDVRPTDLPGYLRN